MGTIGFLLALIVVVAAILIYALRLQRKAVATQDMFAADHQLEKARRERYYQTAEETAETLKKAVQRDEEAIQLLRRQVELQEQILKAMNERKS